MKEKANNKRKRVQSGGNTGRKRSRRMSTGDWISFLTSQSTSAIAIMVSFVALIISFAAVTSVQFSSANQNVKFELSIMSMVLILLIVSILITILLFGRYTASNKILEAITEKNVHNPKAIREKWVKAKRKSEKITIIISCLFLSLAGLLAIALAVCIIFLYPVNPDPSIARYELETKGHKKLYTNKYEIRQGAIIIHGWYTGRNKYNSEIIVMLDDMVKITDRKVQPGNSEPITEP